MINEKKSADTCSPHEEHFTLILNRKCDLMWKMFCVWVNHGLEWDQHLLSLRQHCAARVTIPQRNSAGVVFGDSVDCRWLLTLSTVCLHHISNSYILISECLNDIWFSCMWKWLGLCSQMHHLLSANVNPCSVAVLWKAESLVRTALVRLSDAGNARQIPAPFLPSVINSGCPSILTLFSAFLFAKSDSWVGWVYGELEIERECVNGHR